MKKIKQMQADHIYLIRGSSSANSSFFECENDAKYFLKLVDRFLGEYMSVNSFQNNRDGWVLIISTRSVEEIRTAYAKRRAQSNKCNPAYAHSEVWRILSDQVRILLSTYVKWTNSHTGRTGGKVKRNYERFIFESLEEALEMKENLENQLYDQSQSKKRYRPSKKHFKMTWKAMKSSIYMCCARLSDPRNVVKLGLRCLNLISSTIDVLRQVIKTTLQYHFPT